MSARNVAALQRSLGNAAVARLIAVQRSRREVADPSPAADGPPGLSGPGAPLGADVAETLRPRFEFDLADVRVHTDQEAARSASDLGALGYTWGRHVVLGGPAASGGSAGLSVLAHELTHVGQHLGGNTDSAEAHERAAEAVEAGGSFASAAAGGSDAAPARASSPVLRLRPGDATDLTITLGADGSATFRAEVEGVGTVTGTGTVTNLTPGEYRVRTSGAGEVTVTAADGSVVPRSSRFFIPSTEANAPLIRACSRVQTPIPMRVVGDPAGAVPRAGTAEADAATAGTGDAHGAVDALPDRLRNFLFRRGGPPRPEDFPILLRIAQRVAHLSDAELADYHERTTGGTPSAATFEADVGRWLAQLEERRRTARAQDEATQALFGLDAIYDMYRGWQTGLLMGGPPSWIHEWEALPVSALPADREGSLNQLYLRMRRALAPHGFANLAAFSAVVQRFIEAFRENAYQVGLDLLQRYEHLLIVERDRYRREGTGSLHSALGPARSTFRGADEYAAAARSQHGGGLSPSEINAFYAAGAEYRRRMGEGNAQVTAVSRTDPLLANQDFPREELARADAPGTTSVMNRYIASGQEHIRETRSRLGADHELIFRLDLLVAQTKERQGITADSIWDKIIRDHQAPTLDDVALQAMIAALAVAVGLLSGGSVVAAIASVGLSSYLAIEQYEDYAVRSDAYGAQLLSEEPELGWVVLAIIGVGVELAAVTAVIRAIRPALQQFQRTRNVAELETRLGGVEARIRRAILDRAALEARAAQGWEGLVPRGAVRGSVFGLEFAAEMLGKFVYAVQLNLRRGVNSFNRWVLTREAVDLIGQANQLNPAQLRQVRALYRQAVDEAQRIATHARTIGMPAEEADALMLAWARRGSGTADDVMREMTAARAGRPPDPAAAGWTPPRGWNGPANHGRWSGTRGNSGWIDDRPEVIRVVGRSSTGEANPIFFREGTVDFSPWSQGEIIVPGITGHHPLDMTNIRIAIADLQRLLPGGSRTARANAAIEWLNRAPDGFGGVGLRPHHAGGDRIELIPKDLHKVQHTDLAIYPGE
jgi:hypothetical protein